MKYFISIVLVSLITVFYTSYCQEESREGRPMRLEFSLGGNSNRVENCTGGAVCMLPLSCIFNGWVKTRQLCSMRFPFFGFCCAPRQITTTPATPSRTTPAATRPTKVSYFENSQGATTGTYNREVRAFSGNVRQLRLDFEIFNLTAPAIDGTSAPACRVDTFSITSTNNNVNIGIAALCGENAGQHLYVPVNSSNAGDTIATLNVTIGPRSSGATTNPSWRIRITQLEGPSTQSTTQNSPDVLAPSGCLQYYTEERGRFETFNYNGGQGPYIGEQAYGICFSRPPSSTSLVMTPVNFNVGFNRNDNNNMDRDCDTPTAGSPNIQDYLRVPNGSKGNNMRGTLFCGTIDSSTSITTTSIGNIYYVIWNSGSVANGQNQRGFRLTYVITS